MKKTNNDTNDDLKDVRVLVSVPTSMSKTMKQTQDEDGDDRYVLRQVAACGHAVVFDGQVVAWARDHTWSAKIKRGLATIEKNEKTGD